VYRANVSRYCVPVQASHPVVSGLDIHDFARLGRFKHRASAAHSHSRQKRRSPYGWHWGNRGGVASAAIEKPHLAGWRPILHGEFDMAYSP
jgi:beta-galactosidase